METRKSEQQAEPGYRLTIDRKTEGGLIVALHGRVGASNAQRLEQELRTALGDLTSGASVTLQFGGANVRDSALAVVTIRLQRELDRQGVACSIASLDSTTRALLDLVDPKRIEESRPLQTPRTSIPQQVGESVLSRVAQFFEMVLFIGKVSSRSFGLCGSRGRCAGPRWRLR